LALTFVPLLLEMTASISPVLWLFLLPLGLIYIPIVGSFDRDACIYPLREIFKSSPEVQATLDALGDIDELFSFLRYRESFGHPSVLAEMTDSPRHTLDLKGVRNPILAKGNPAYVDNSLGLDKERLALITGPNSGGKTAFCKTLAQTQLLAQIGCYVPAQQAKLAVADHIHYQTPEISHLADGEGRFGTELKRTKEVFMASTARSLVIMD
jgi:DNA mismatch repair protein MutS